jgi:hypothetical protein
VRLTIVLDDIKDKCLCDKVKENGGECVKLDITKQENLKNLLPKDCDTIISCVFGDDRTLINGQCNLLNYASQLGYKRFVASDFLSNIWNCKLGESYLIDQRLKFRDSLNKSNVKGLHFSHGIFMETYFWLAEKCGYFGYWGDKNQKIDLTSQEDVAKFVAAAVSRENLTGDVCISGGEYSTEEIANLYNHLTGKNLEVKCLGSIDDLKKNISEFKSTDDPFMLVQYSIMLPLFDGRGKIKNRMNSQFPEVKVTTLEDFIGKIQSKGLQYNYTLPDLVRWCETEIKS